MYKPSFYDNGKCVKSLFKVGDVVVVPFKVEENQTQGKFRSAVPQICLSRQVSHMRRWPLEIQIWVEIQNRDTLPDRNKTNSWRSVIYSGNSKAIRRKEQNQQIQVDKTVPQIMLSAQTYK